MMSSQEKNKKPGEIPPVDKEKDHLEEDIQDEDIPQVDEAKDIPKNESVLTYNDLEKEKCIEKPEEKPVNKKKKKKPKLQFECSFAPMGDAKTNIKYKLGDKEVIKKIVLHNKIYEYPVGLSPEEDKALRKALTDNGFVDVTVLKAKFNKVKKQYIFSAMHPDHSKADPINANISLPILDESGRVICDEKGKQIFKQVAVVNGLVETEDVRVYQALVKAGFKSCFEKEKVREE